MHSSLTALRGVRARAILSLGVVLGLGSVGTLAYWTDSATLTGGSFTTGTLDLTLSGAHNFSTEFAAQNMQPGDSKAAVVTVKNAGSIDFTYTATGSGIGALAPLLRFTVTAGGNLADGGKTCTGGATVVSNVALGANTPVVPTSRSLQAGAEETLCVQATLPATETGGQGSTAQATFTFAAKQVGAP